MSPGAFGQPLPGEEPEQVAGGGGVPPRLPPQPPGRFRDQENPWDDPEGRAFARHVRDVTIPMLKDSALTMGLLSPASTGASFDVRQAVEIGASLLMGKPLVLAVEPGSHVPDGLARAADEIVEVDLKGDPEGTAATLAAVHERVLRARGEWED